ncbi:MAG TPA: FAD-binding oxidoreductase [Miltoncostaeaceae bacterium]|nr:FAD-binding oxidoreductase [Miltoncostaeaceae bacterium]
MATEAPTALRGEVLHPGMPGYDQARRIWNAAVDRRPAVIVRARAPEDVAAALRFAQRHGLEVAVRGGGHSIPGHSAVDGGLMIDLSPMKGIRVDPAARRAEVGAGVLWGELDAATQAHGLAVTGGEVSHTGVAGLTLGGGIGLLKRRFGLTCDNLLGVRMVTVDGRIVDADDPSEPDLMWALRGGGGNFGVVTRFTFRLHPVGPVIPTATAVHDMETAAEALVRFARAAAVAPDALTLWAVMATAPPAPVVPPGLVGRPALLVNAAWISEEPAPDLAQVVAAPGSAVWAGEMPYVVMQSLADAFAPPGRANHARSEWMRDVSPAVAADLAAAAAAAPSAGAQIVIHQMGAAAGRVDPASTAFARRDAPLMMLANAAWAPGDDPTPHREWVHRVHASVMPDTAGGAYVNHLGEEGGDRVRAAYGDATYARLARIKAVWDPGNVLRRNQNVRPT